MTRWEIVLVVVFAVVTARIVAPYLVYPTAFGGDARVYAEGARLWLTGGTRGRPAGNGRHVRCLPTRCLLRPVRVPAAGGHRDGVGDRTAGVERVALRRLRMPLCGSRFRRSRLDRRWEYDGLAFVPR
jgi:hypothetical protein